MSATTEQRHPFTNHKHPIDTSQTDRLMLAMQQWLWVGTPGGFIYGLPRVGKTFGVEYCAERLKTRTGGPTDLIYYSCQRDQAKTDKKFWSLLLVAMERGLVHSHTAVQLYEQLLGQIDEMARINREHQVLLCLDEAQYLSRKELQWLISLHNDLCHHDINMLVLLVGTMELKERQSQFSGPEDGHIKGRFFISEHRFFGIKGKSELHSFLSIFDDTAQWQNAPAPSKRYFANTPLARTRLCDYVNEFLNVWRLRIEPTGRKEWPLFYLNEAVRTFLIDYVPRIRSADDIEQHIAGAIKASGILPEDDWN